MAFHIVQAKPEAALALAEAIRHVKQLVKTCSVCHNLTEVDPCILCTDPGRDHGLICVVEGPKELLQLEGTGVYRGLYHVLHGQIAPLDDQRPERLTIGDLVERVKASKADGQAAIREVILATNPTADGDGTALYIQEQLAPLGVAVTRLARGLPSGAQIEYANKAILADALTGRTKA
jgi:recombination protein RecR